MFGEEQASKIHWFARLEIEYIQLREDKKISDQAIFRGYSKTHP